MDVAAHTSEKDGQKTQEEVQELVRRACGGDAEAFGVLYDTYLDSVYRYVFYKVGDATLAEDLTAQLFMKAWEAMPRYQLREIPFSHWLMRLARNAVIDYYRTSRVQGELDEGLVSREPDPLGEYLQGERVRGLQRALQRLPEEHRTVIVLRFIEEMDYAQVAEIVGKSQGALRVIQHRALQTLRRILQREGEEGVSDDRGGPGRMSREGGAR
ncbi:MAG TPA: sigma-70 family RNA polymerase sigma factor [Chloroflexota bacterium]|nr:sigma-70 family RNA polymerase sigma factor [Chloroflexota bacterium]